MSHSGKWTVIDLFSGAGGMSYGFHAHPDFEIVGACDIQVGKPSSGKGALQCNQSYLANMGLEPYEADLSIVEPKELSKAFSSRLANRELTVLISCAPCTGFSRALANNHIKDDTRNSLVTRTFLFTEEFRPAILLMENARELIKGNFTHHYLTLRKKLIEAGYTVSGKIHFLNKFGLPQTRERALVIAVRNDLHLKLRTLDDLWHGYGIEESATHVRRAIGSLPKLEAGEYSSDDPLHLSPRFSSNDTKLRLKYMPKDGGSWIDLKDHSMAEHILTPAMKRYIAKGDFGSHPDVYGRLWWDKPAVTIKRECSHVGNGRYSHPEQDRLCTVREMGILQGFPNDYKFVASGLSNMYRHIGDAVPPLISYQLARICEWMLTDIKPEIDSCILPNTHLTSADINVTHHRSQLALPLQAAGL